MSSGTGTSNNTDPITGKLDEKYRQAKSARRLLEPQWFMSLAFFQNRQWLAFAGDRLIEPRGLDDPGRITETENRITGIVRTELAKLTKGRPVWSATPTSSDDEDMNAADLSERIMRYQWQNLNVRKHDLKALEWSRICGSGFLKVVWDPTLGDPVDVLVRPDGGLMADETGKTMRGDSQVAKAFAEATGAEVKSKRIAPGDLKVEAPSPFGMFVDPLCDVFEDAEWLIEESVKSVDYVKRHYDVTLKPDTSANPGLVEMQLMGGTAGAGTTYKGVKLRQYWSKPCEEFPAGVRIVWAQGKVLDRDDKPFDPMPYIMYTGIPVPGRLHGMGIVELLQGPQTELNLTLSQMAENRNRVGNPTGVAAKQAIGDPEIFLEKISQAGGWHFFDESGSAHPIPQYLEPPALPDYVKDTPDSIRRAMEDISGQHEVTNAQVPPGVTAAAAISLLLDQDDTRLALAVTDHEEGLGRIGTKVLEHVARYYTDSRMIKIAGDDGAWEIFDFRNTDLRGNTHIEVQANSTFPQTQAAKQAMMKDIITMMTQTGNGLHGRQLSQFFRDLGLGATDHLIQEYTRNETQVNRENVILARGVPLPINPSYDDNQAHVDGHTDYMKSATYAKFSPQVKKCFEDHLAAHQQELDKEQQAQLQMQLQLTGQVPPTMSQAALQDVQQLSQLHGQQQEIQGQQQQQQQQLQGAQLQQLIQAMQGQQQGASAEQALQHAAEAHAMKMHGMAQEERRAEEAHQARIQSMRNPQRNGGSR
jgi:hypothetical protein